MATAICPGPIAHGSFESRKLASLLKRGGETTRVLFLLVRQFSVSFVSGTRIGDDVIRACRFREVGNQLKGDIRNYLENIL